ncbi:MAG: 4Fe-4S binding protein [Candidatus Bathyarchaeota archaeon]|nr:4Fe-4S binding protein [Candidatus Bathyarchaeota archaeon]
MAIKQRIFLSLLVGVLIAVSVLSVVYIEPVNSCYGPHITSEIDRNYVYINETVTVTGQVCPAEENKTIRVAFTRPDYTFIEQYVLTDPETGNFSVTQQLDMVGYWNIFPIHGHICDRLFAEVTDPTNPEATAPTPNLPAMKVNYSVIAAAVAFLSVGTVALVAGRKNKTRKISSLRLFVQIGFIFFIFFGIFIDHQRLPVPAEQIAPHEALIGNNVLGVSMPDGIPMPFFGCYYPCGKTVTCALWEIQSYIYPFFDVGRGWGVNYDSPGILRLTVVFGVIILAAVVLGRFFCGWICPFGLYVDLMTRLRKALRIKRRELSEKFNGKFHQLGYVILAVIIILSVLFASQTLTGTQLVAGTEKGGFVYQYFSAPFCQVCPMKPLCMLSQTSVGLLRTEWIFETTTGDFYQLGFYVTSLNLIILGIVTLAAFFVRRSWCRICPLGALIALFNRFPPFKWISGVRLNKVEEKCTKCGVCKRVCPTQVTEVYEQKSGDVASSQCIYCLRCVEMCPYEDCLQFKFAGKTVCKSRNWLNDSNSLKVIE